MSTKNQREELVHSLMGQATTIIFVIIISWFYILPKYVALTDSIDKTNTLIKEYQDTYKNGILYTKLDGMLSSKGKVELLSIIQSAPKETQVVIKNISGEPYLDWINSEINKSSTDEIKLSTKRARLNSILPTLNPINNNLIQETINLKKYISFIEINILKQFGIESITPLGLQGIRYGKKGGTIPESVGSIDTDITFKTTNGQIYKMINYINGLGKYDILNDTNISSSGGNPSIMSNPLVMIDSFSLNGPFNPNKPNDENGGNMTIRFYIRGSSPDDIVFLSENLKSRKETLGKKISTTLDACIGELTCPRKKDLEIVSRKFLEYTRAIDSKINIKDDIYALSSELDAIIAIEKEFINVTR
ncbi:hypothetical protein HOO68_00500 [Candidatus Gracilibacteria bacterium]|nr:hypothetical protein [Candidatus Gracilibacteria bacterium]